MWYEFKKAFNIVWFTKYEKLNVNRLENSLVHLLLVINVIHLCSVMYSWNDAVYVWCNFGAYLSFVLWTDFCMTLAVKCATVVSQSEQMICAINR
jgi:hypothetical protein